MDERSRETAEAAGWTARPDLDPELQDDPELHEEPADAEDDPELHDEAPQKPSPEEPRPDPDGTRDDRRLRR